MSILIPVVSTGITLTEVPDKVSFYIELGGCIQRCKGCHSPHLQQPVTYKTSLDSLMGKVCTAIDKGANAIVLMGGTTNEMSTKDLQLLINRLAEEAPVCLYSGSDDKRLNHHIAETTDLTWIKTGSYKEDLGGLSSPTTNQRFYRKEIDVVYTNYQIETIKSRWIDCTHIFQK